ncbi:protein TBATA [Brienomyrus brachyistius]|uniref:protein TBATA n=1 Tax=Brienomyrus brachyistius TaxID=42636 RepID=UPI0020B3AFFD|nr:protein TBATA [Brienomyrus brachyistius]XP_048844183.1 protein TBATA [Brienomyrus brachyistius]XP_048844184.1 protein TBATA [Brienomyrus brachyistius]
MEGASKRDTEGLSRAARCQEAGGSRMEPGNSPFEKAMCFLAERVREPPRGVHRFGTLSHHSFFSRHNPHPHRVTHFQGLNGTPVCIVNDDLWTSTPSPLHPLIKSQMPLTVARATPDPFLRCRRDSWTNHTAVPLSEAWREELRELAAKVRMSAGVTKEKKSQVTEGTSGRMTQYSAKTGRIIPASTRACSRHSTQASSRHGRPGRHPPSPGLYDQELTVLELLCQVLQTDSLSQVQQWLLYADQREKDFVMELIQQAVDASVLDSLAKGVAEPLPALSSSTKLPGRNYGFDKATDIIKEEDRPELIGTAEVLQVNTEEGLQ